MIIAAIALVSSLPADVKAFLKRHAHCAAVLYMDYPNVTARNYGETEAPKCAGIDKQRRDLIVRYRHRPKVRAVIARREKLDT